MRCNRYGRFGRCHEPGRWVFYTPGGQRVMACCYCTAHAKATLQEYHDKLHQAWSAREVDAMGLLVPDGRVLTPAEVARA